MKKSVNEKKNEKQKKKLQDVVKQEVSKKKENEMKVESRVVKADFSRKSSKESITATIKKEFKSDIEGVEKCKVCNGTGQTLDSKGKKHICSACSGAGITYTPPKRIILGRSTGDKPKVKKEEPVTFIKTETIKKEIKFKSFKSGKFTYLVSRDMIIRDTLAETITPDGEIEDCLDKILKPYYKRLGVETLSQVKASIKSVQGVRYKVEQNCERVTLSGKLTGNIEYVKSGLKFSNQTWIDSKYLEVFKNHRFIYLNPLKDEVLPVLVIDKSTNKLEGVIMPLVRR